MINSSADKSKQALVIPRKDIALYMFYVMESLLSQHSGQQHHFGARRHSSYVTKE